ncbi:helix-turn-helix domain-containing protein [Glutamicibacter uratoxydans]|uniref:helix-turn-helix domain-containing protein n=1 Tax=Glutamicibacter uratoxydans TaxID=43667 RepID=UPI003D6FA46F
MNSLSDVGAAIQTSRKESGLTQEQLADLAGISERTLRSIESGNGNPSFAAVLATLNVLGIRLLVVP